MPTPCSEPGRSPLRVRTKLHHHKSKRAINVPSFPGSDAMWFPTLSKNKLQAPLRECVCSSMNSFQVSALQLYFLRTQIFWFLGSCPADRENNAPGLLIGIIIVGTIMLSGCLHILDFHSWLMFGIRIIPQEQVISKLKFILITLCVSSGLWNYSLNQYDFDDPYTASFCSQRWETGYISSSQRTFEGGSLQAPISANMLH